jgi:hypothetical protein
MPFRSKAQQRMFFARGKTDPKFAKMADEFAHSGPDGYIKKLPGRINTKKDKRKADRAIKSFKESALNIMFGFDDG